MGSDSVAVRLAMAETQVISENKAFLKDHGVQLNAFDTRVRVQLSSRVL